MGINPCIDIFPHLVEPVKPMDALEESVKIKKYAKYKCKTY